MANSAAIGHMMTGEALAELLSPIAATIPGGVTP